jgi:hypothetical protein
MPPGFEILISADGRFLYAGNRLHDSIGIFSIGPDGRLAHVGDEWTRGDYQRSFNFDPTGQFFYCLNQRSDNIAVFRVDRQTGRLNFTDHYTPSAIRRVSCSLIWRKRGECFPEARESSVTHSMVPARSLISLATRTYVSRVDLWLGRLSRNGFVVWAFLRVAVYLLVGPPATPIVAVVAVVGFRAATQLQ